MPNNDRQSERARRERSPRGGLWRAIQMLEEAAAEAAADTDWIDAALADAMAAQGVSAIAVIDDPLIEVRLPADRGNWTHLWRCRPEGLPANRASQCCSGGLGPDGRCVRPCQI